MEETSLGLRTIVPVPYAEAVARTTEALKLEGFGVLTTIDVAATLKQKLDVPFQPYAILGACNPPLAHRALIAERDIGLLLPCNVIVYETGPSESVVAAVAPLAMIGLAGRDPRLVDVAHDADARLHRVVQRVEAAAARSGQP